MPLLGVGKSSLRPMGMTAQQFRGRGKKVVGMYMWASLLFTQVLFIRVNDLFI